MYSPVDQSIKVISLSKVINKVNQENKLPEEKKKIGSMNADEELKRAEQLDAIMNVKEF